MKQKILPLLIFVFTISSVIAQVNITFEVNTATIPSVDAAGLFLAGGTGFGVPGDNPMVDSDGDGIYTVTLQRDQGFSSHYTFLNGNCADWTCKENLGNLPCGDPNNFDDRFLPAVMSDTTILACFGTCDDDGSCTIVTDSVDITFELNTATIPTIDPAGIFIAGGSGFGNPGDNPLVDPDGDGIYTTTISKPMGFTSNYIFLNGNCSDYNCKENLAGLPCADPNNFNDRLLPPVMSDTTILACFGTCDDDGSCTIVTDSIEITFQLNTSSITVDPAGVFIAGGGNFGAPGDNPMVDPDGDGIYTFTTKRPVGFVSFYTFANGNCPDFSCKEDISGQACADPNNFDDRFFPGAIADTTILACFGNCVDDGSCDEVSISGLEIDKNLFSIRPTIVNDYINLTFGENNLYQEKQMVIMNSVGQIFQITEFQNNDSYRINTEQYPSGIYFMTIKTNNKMLTKRFVVQK